MIIGKAKYVDETSFSPSSLSMKCLYKKGIAFLKYYLSVGPHFNTL